MADKPVFDLFEPGELTAYSREALAEQNAGETIHRYLPYVPVNDPEVRFNVTEQGLIEEATFRQFGTQPDAGRGRGFARRVVELMPIGRRDEMNEQDQMRLNKASTEEQRQAVFASIDVMVEAVSERLQRLAGQAIDLGKADIEEYGGLGQDFNRDASMEVTASVLWDTDGADPLTDLQGWVQAYRAKNKRRPGAIVMSSRAAFAMQARMTAKYSVAAGNPVPMNLDQVNQLVVGQGLPRVEVFDRETFSGRVLPDNRVYLVPEAGATQAQRQNPLGATFWGKTLASTLPEFGLRPAEQPGLLAADYLKPGYPPVRQMIVDGLAMPILTNANLAMRAEVLAAA